jgi:hypothetical protein
MGNLMPSALREEADPKFDRFMACGRIRISGWVTKEKTEADGTGPIGFV